MKSRKSLILSAGLLLTLQLPVLAGTKAEDAFQQGQIFASNKSYDKAIDAYAQAAAADPDHFGSKARIGIAIVLIQKKEFDKAAKLLEEVQKQQPANWVSYKVMGKLRSEQNRPGDAADAFEAYLRLIPAENLKPKDRESLLKDIAALRQKAASQPAAPAAPENP